MATPPINARIEKLLNAWCERREFAALAALLPAWVNNFGLTDGWADLAYALNRVRDHQQLPPAERDELKKLWIEVDMLVRRG
jgi:hypothetical protein